MIYSSGSRGVFQSAANLAKEITSPNATLLSRKVETSEPKELDEHYLKQEVESLIHDEGKETGGSTPASGTATPAVDSERKFAKPRGPARRAR